MKFKTRTNQFNLNFIIGEFRPINEYRAGVIWTVRMNARNAHFLNAICMNVFKQQQKLANILDRNVSVFMLCIALIQSETNHWGKKRPLNWPDPNTKMTIKNNTNNKDATKKKTLGQNKQNILFFSNANESERNALHDLSKSNYDGRRIWPNTQTSNWKIVNIPEQ